MSVDLLAFLGELELWQWLAIGVGGTGWLWLTSWLGNVTEAHGSDRETGVLIGFSLLGLIGFLIWWLV